MSDFQKTYSITIHTKKARETLRRLRESVDKLDKKIVKAAIHSQKLVRIFGKMGQSLISVEHNAKDAGRSVNTFVTKTVVGAKKAERSVKKVGRSLKNVSQKLQTVGRNMSMYVTLPLVGAGVASLKFARDMNAGMAKIATLIPGQTKRIAQLKTEIQALSKETGVSTGDLAEGVYAAISAWGDSAETMKRMRVVTMAAQAGYASTKDTLGLFATITENYGDSTAEATAKVADMAFVTNKLAQEAPFADMAASMGKVIPIAKQLGITQEDVFSTMAAGAGVIGTVSEVSTQIRSLYISALKPAAEMDAVIAKTNLQMGTKFKSAAEMLGALGTKGYVDQIKKNTKNTEEFTKAVGGRTEGLVMAMALAGSRGDKYNESMKEMTTRTGQMKEAHKEVTDGINEAGHAWEQFKSDVEVLAQNVGDRLIPAFMRFLDFLKPTIDYVSELSDENLDLGLKIAGVVIAIGPMIKALGALKVLYVFILANPITAILAGTAVVLGLIYTNSELVHGSFEYLITSLEQVYLWMKKIFVGQHVTMLGKILGVDLSGAGLTSGEIDQDMANAAERKSSIDFRDKDVVNREAKNKLSLHKTASNISKYGGGGGSGFSDEFSMQSLAGAGAGGGGGTSIGGTVVNFNGPVADPAKAVRQAGRAARAEDRKRAKQYDSTANNSGPMEQ